MEGDAHTLGEVKICIAIMKVVRLYVGPVFWDATTLWVRRWTAIEAHGDEASVEPWWILWDAWRGSSARGLDALDWLDCHRSEV